MTDTKSKSSKTKSKSGKEISIKEFLKLSLIPKGLSTWAKRKFAKEMKSKKDWIETMKDHKVIVKD